MNRTQSLILFWIARLSAIILALMPFHAFLTVWASSLIGQYTALRLWKEVLLLALIGCVIYLLATHRPLRARVQEERLLWVIGAYLLLVSGMGLLALVLGAVVPKALAFGVLLDTRFLVFFIVTWVLTQYSDVLVKTWGRLLLVPGAITVAFATLQWTVLPVDFLRHFGYGPETIPAAAAVDQKADYARIQSTLRGANPFGAYLTIFISGLGLWLLAARRRRGAVAVYFVLAMAALYFTYSRSAWLGTFVSLACIIWWVTRNMVSRRLLLVGGVAAVLAFVGVGFALRDNDHFQNLAFHTNEHSQSQESSTAIHFRAAAEGVQDIVEKPWGSGPGTAGPASVYNDDPRIAENYYVQVGQETGVIGLALFLAINVLIVRRLWAGRRMLLSQILLASFIGLAIVNMLLHAWTDDTLAYVWWGLAGVAVGALQIPIRRSDEKASS